MLDGKEGDNVQDVDTDCCIILKIRDLDADVVYKFGELTGTYIGEFNFSLDKLAHLMYLFALGVPAYRIRFYVPLSLTTMEKTFRIFRQSIYNESLLKLKELKKLSGELEIDEALFGGHRKGKRGWGSEGKNLVFGIYQRNGKVITFPVSDRKHDRSKISSEY